MYFKYQSYFEHCLVVPVLVVLFSIVMVICIAVKEIKTVKAEMYTTHWNPHDSSGYIIPFIIPAILIYLHIGPLLHGGLFLAFERESDAIEIHGMIEETALLSQNQFLPIHNNYSQYQGDVHVTNGIQFTVDNIKATAFVKGNLKLGDEVYMIYLPKSGYILYIGCESPG